MRRYSPIHGYLLQGISVILNLAIIAVIALTPIWVYLDATKHKIGKVEGISGLTNNSAGVWGIVTLGLWIVTFPLYLIKRKALIERAQEHPVEVKGRAAKATVFAIIGGSWVALAALGTAAQQLPTCDAAETAHVVASIINDLPIAKASGARFVSLKGITEQGYNATDEIRSCRATLITSAGEDTVQYSLRWQNKDALQFYAEVRIQ